MNAISLYVSTSRLIFQNDSNNKNLNDLYRLLPYLRQSLSCKTCGKLLVEPYSPNSSKCQHHICKLCIDERKNSKTTCMWCCDKQNFAENRQLRILLQCYKSLCEHIKLTPLYHEIHNNTILTNNLNFNNEQQTLSTSTTSILDLIEEGAKFQDDFTHSGGLTKSAYSILPSIYTMPNSSTPTVTNNTKFVTATTISSAPPLTLTTTPALSIIKKEPELVKIQEPRPDNRQIMQGIQSFNKTQLTQYQTQHQQITTQQIPTSSSVYSVLYAGSGNKITIKRKLDNNITTSSVLSSPNNVIKTTTLSPQLAKFKRPIPSSTIPTQSTAIYKQNIIPTASSSVLTNISTSLTSPTSLQIKKKGCRCGNATLTPGKLTCCGQRCPCYVESKSCIDCKCRGCRNPHHPNGFKVRPHIPQVHLTQTKQVANTLALPPLTQTTPTITLNQSQLSQLSTTQSPQSQLQHQLHKITQHNSTQSSTPTLTLTSTPTIYINDLNQFNLTSDSTINQTGTCVQLQQFLNSALPVTSTHQSPAAFNNSSNFNQFLNNTIIFNPADIPTIIDGGSIQTAEISIDL